MLRNPWPVMRRLWIVVVMLAVVAPAAVPGISLFAQPQPEVQVGQWQLTSVVDWQGGAINGLIISNNAGGELRLQDTQSSGSFLSPPFELPFPINAVGAVWRADLTEGTSVALELRGRARPITTLTDTEQTEDAAEEGWGDWQSLTAGDARSQADDGAFATPDVITLPLDTRYIQLRVSFASEVARASAVLNEVTVAYLNTTQGGPGAPRGLQRVPIIYGPDTLTPRPTLIPRSTWFTEQNIYVRMWESTPKPTQVMTDTWRPGLPAARPDRVTPRGIILHQIDASTEVSETLTLLRALATYQIQVLGWDDMPYHYLIDQEGTLYEGRLGGPTAAVSRLSGGDAAIHIALIGSRDAAPDESAQATLVSLLAWLGQAFDIPPTGEHPVVVGDERVTRPNIAGHADAAPEAPDPGEPLRELLPPIRERANESTVRTRQYFPEGNVDEYTQRFVFFNPGSAQTNATVTLLRSRSEAPVVRIVTVPAGDRADLVVNEIVSGTTSLPAIVESSDPILTERILDLPTDTDNSRGISQSSRVWYFAEGSTDAPFNTYLVLFNPQVTPTTATVTYMKGDGTLANQEISLLPLQRLVVTVSDNLPDVGFGTRIIASQPIVAERTMRFGPEGSGLHTNPGIAELSRTWYFAEGTTTPPFQMRLLLLNPNRQTANVTVTFMTPDGTTLTLKRRYAIPPTTRLVVDVNEVVPALGVSTVVESDRPVAAERAMYFNFTSDEDTGLAPTAGSVSTGAGQPAYDWRFVDEERNADTRQFLLFSNPNRNQASVTVEFLLPDSSTETQTVVMPANSRYTMAVHEVLPDQPILSIRVRATQRIVAERSIFTANGGGTTILGIPGGQ